MRVHAPDWPWWQNQLHHMEPWAIVFFLEERPLPPDQRAAFELELFCRDPVGLVEVVTGKVISDEMDCC